MVNNDSMIGLISNAFRARGEILEFADEVDSRVTEIDFNELERLAARLTKYEPAGETNSNEGDSNAAAARLEAEQETARRVAETEALQRQEQEVLEALSTLPATAQRMVEMAWIESHPAMLRVGDGPFTLKAIDLLDPPHGVCPSRSAANQLGHWINNRPEFFRSLSKSPRPEDEPDQVDGFIADPKVEEIEEMLQQLQEAAERETASHDLETVLNVLDEKLAAANSDIPHEVLQRSAEQLGSLSARLNSLVVPE
ncbi:hypothetical protein NZK35_05605 [Stieleria sp. ICT_E10.1]|uniref:hypothetical protein n=1 Tax=Stieleria sedimenti TaxID=2976331 RepID=UPI00217F42C5|nr:hypothetical protein [Stieleria sedimenti]MCS7466149.1 hypothetical protein [Stieleria sedimenti]